MEQKYQYRIRVPGATRVFDLLNAFQKGVPGFHWWLNKTSTNTLHTKGPDLSALVALDRYVDLGPFDLTITVFEARDREQAQLGLLGQVLQTLDATVWKPDAAGGGALYSIWVDYHLRGVSLFTGVEFEPYQFGEFTDCSIAQAACRKMVDEDIAGRARPGVSLEQVMENYREEGIHLRIIHSDGSPASCEFLTAEYARRRARELAGDLWNEADAKSGRSMTARVETGLASSEIVNRIRSLGEPRTYGGLTHAGGLDCILRLEDGGSMRFRREAIEGPVELSVVQPSGGRTPYRSEERRWEHAAVLLETQPAEERAFQTLREAAQEGAKRVDLSCHGLTRLPAELSILLPDVVDLQLSGNWLRELPPELFLLSKLEVLNVENNLLTGLPPEIAHLRNLRALNASGNLLSEVPDGICELSNLAGLSLSSNRLKAIPADIWRLTRLETLRLDRNWLSSIPAQAGQLTRLKKLTLDHNLLGSLPLEIGRLKNLKDYEERVPDPKKRHLPSPDELCGLSAGANPMGGPPPSLFGRELRDYLAKKLEERVAAVAWQDVVLEHEAFAIRMPGPPLRTLFDGPPKTLQYKVRFNQCLFSVAARELPQTLDLAVLEQSLERMESDHAAQWAKPVIRTKRALGALPGIEYVVATLAGVLRLRTYLSTSRLYQVQVEGLPEFAFAAESDYFLDSFRATPPVTSP